MFHEKNLVIDTSVLIDSPSSIHSFDNSNIFLTIEVLEELDNHKTRKDNVGKSARYVNRFLDKVRQTGSLIKGATIENGSKIYVVNGGGYLAPGISESTNDNKIISAAFKLKENIGDIIVLSNDIAFRVKCDSIGIDAKEYSQDTKKETKTEKFSGVRTIEVDPEDIEIIYQEDSLIIPGANFEYNECVILKHEKTSALAVAKDDMTLKKLKYANKKDFSCEGIRPRSAEQTFAMEMLVDPEIDLVTVTGKAGCGKTLMAIASAIHNLHQKKYSKIIISRPVESTSKDIGYLPGPQPLDAKILTPKGWMLMGELNIGDYVIAKSGNKTKILDIFPKGKKDVYEIKTSDGRKTEACADHLWFTTTLSDKKNNNSGSIKTTSEIAASLREPRFKNRLNHFLPRVNPVVYDSKDMIIPAYTLGVLLGDGSISNSISIYNTDMEIIDRVKEELKTIKCDIKNIKETIQYTISAIDEHRNQNNKLGKEVILTYIDSGESIKYINIGKALKEVAINSSTLNSRCKNNAIVDGIQYSFGSKESTWSNPLIEKLEQLGLMGAKAYNKFIPNDYLYASSIEDRISLLRGLMDTDGCVKKSTGEATYYTASKRLADDVVSLVRSLGGNASYSLSKAKQSRINGRDINGRYDLYSVSIGLSDINPFFVSRKNIYYHKNYLKGIKIESIELIAKKDVQCILIEDSEHLYVTDDFIVTHNTKEEKMQSWVQPIFDNLEAIFGKRYKDYVSQLTQKGQLEVEALTFIRGRTLPNTIFIIDEAQNINYNEVKAIVTRMGENSKIILIGDLEQIDSEKLTESTSGLGNAIEIFKGYKGAAHISLRKGERSALATYAAENM